MQRQPHGSIKTFFFFIVILSLRRLDWWRSRNQTGIRVSKTWDSAEKKKEEMRLSLVCFLNQSIGFLLKFSYLMYLLIIVLYCFLYHISLTALVSFQMTVFHPLPAKWKPRVQMRMLSVSDKLNKEIKEILLPLKWNQLF